ncbi:MAG: hypothetical protein AB1847_07260 [bacterium]
MAEEALKDTLAVYLKRVNKISRSEIEKMFLLHTQYFDQARMENFVHDLKEKDWCILIGDEDKSIKGYSSLQLIDTTFDGKQCKFLFSGDTLVAQENWRDNLLTGAFGHFVLYLNQKFPHHELYWLLISKGFRTYRFLSLYYKEFYPVYDRQTPENVKALMDHICSIKFASRYDSQSGLVLTDGQSDYLKPHMAAIRQGRQSNPHISYFLKKNPRYYLGDELVCIASLKKENFKSDLMERVIRSVSVEWIS